MSRDHRKLRVFAIADELVIEIYRATRHFPPEEQFGLRAQVRRAAVSAASNIVEGSARRTSSEYANFLSLAHGSAAEARYLVDLTMRLGFLTSDVASRLVVLYTDLMKGLNRFMRTLRHDQRRANG